MTAPVDPNRFEEMYRDGRTAHGLPAATPWDIGGPQPVVQQLVALGAIKGEVLDPGTGPGHHAIHYASKGLSATGVDASPAAIERARQNAQAAGVSVDFQVADATKLEGLDDRFDTVVDCAFYHVFSNEPELQKLPGADHVSSQHELAQFRPDAGAQSRNGRPDKAVGRSIPDHRTVADQRSCVRPVLGSARHPGGLGRPRQEPAGTRRSEIELMQ